jgi:hypothetical protein
MTSDDYWQWNHPPSQSERREVLQKDRDCFHSRAQSAVDAEAGGRFAKINPTNVTGASPSAQIPTQPPTSPWASDPVPPDPHTDQIDYDPNFVEPILQPTPDPETEFTLPVSVEHGEGPESSVGHGIEPKAELSTPSERPATTSLAYPSDGVVAARGGSRSLLATSSQPIPRNPWRRF